MMKKKLSLSFLFFCLILTACNQAVEPAAPTATPETSLPSATLVPSPTSTPLPTAAPEPENALRVCIAEEPSASIFDPFNPDLAAQSLFDMIHFDLFDAVDEKGKPAFLANIPDSQNEGIEFLDVPVEIGQKIMLSNGHILELAEDDAATYLNFGLVEGEDRGNYQMVQTQIVFQLKADLKWSDGAELTANDFIFSYQTARANPDLATNWVLQRTASFTAQDAHTLVWTGIPGFVPADISPLLWLPLPEHLLGALSLQEINALDPAELLPVGWGPFQLVSWEAGNQINFQPNPNFVLKTSELPAIENLIFLIQPEPEAALGMLEAGECDLLDPSYKLDLLGKERLEELAETNNLVFETGQGSVELVFGIMPASYDVDYYSPWISERQDYFGSLETRRAINACLNLPELIDETFHQGFPDFVPLPELKEETEEIDPLQQLEELGWLLPEDEPEGIRVSQDVPDVLDGTEFGITLILGEKETDRILAEAVKNRLSECGIAVELMQVSENELFEPGPQGLLYGRAFDLALVSWPETEGKACERYLSDRIPSPQNNWVGTNAAGLISPGFDELCTLAGAVLNESEEPVEEESVMQEYLPSISLVPNYQIWAYNSRLTVPEGSTFSDLWEFTLN